MNHLKHTEYGDAAGNTYRVEQASNGKFIVARVNAGGNRKVCKGVQASGKREFVQLWLDHYAEKNGLEEV